eukprot:Seg1198.2 transcript_id=Seg1198.2/GoldUCD/mRNA.D3Y31 product="Protein dispatched 1" protein_id=Seg1198.2/GoldUCD/D3Y31
MMGSETDENHDGFEIRRSPSPVMIIPAEKHGLTDKIRRRYASILAKHPWIAFVSTFLMVLLAGTTAFVKELGAKPLPDFSSPSKGFEARGTLISKRIMSHNNLYEVMNGIERLPTSSYIPTIESKQMNTTCTLVVPHYLSSKTIYSTVNKGSDLFNAESLREICNLEKTIVRDEKLFMKECATDPGSSTCCPSLSIGHYAAIYNQKSSCSNITDSDVKNLKKLVFDFKQAVINKGNGFAEMCSPERPAPSNLSDVQKLIACNILQFLVDKDFATKMDPNARLTYSLVFSPIISPSKFLLENMYKSKFKGRSMPTNGKIQLVAYDFENMKTVAYDTQILDDVWYIMTAVVLILALMWAYSGSLFISIMGFSSVAFAIVLSYWLYTVIFRLVFFPFLNIMTTIFVVGIGADDIFVYVLAWRHAHQHIMKTNPDVNTIAKWTEYALAHATAAMFVTSFTTATAFYAGLSSSITAIKCFSIFAGTSILTNYFLMITWLPAVIIAQERFFEPFICKPPPKRKQVHPSTSALSIKELQEGEESTVRRRKFLAYSVPELRSAVKRCSDVLFQDWIAKIVVKLRFVWLAILFILAVFGMLSLTFYPKLSLPTTQQALLFIENHSIEQYDSSIKKKLQIDKITSTDGLQFPVIFVWGVRDVDNGYFLDPASTGSTEWDKTFDISEQSSQKWMLSFCKDVKKADFYDEVKSRSSWCFMEQMKHFVEQPCLNISGYPSMSNSSVCCGKKLPIKPTEFKECTKRYIRSMTKDISANLPIKIDANGHVRAIVFKFYSKQEYLLTFSPVEKFWKRIKSWSDAKISSNIPKGIGNGWVISDLYFYDLQKNLADGTVKTIAVSIGISAIVLLATTQNIVITLYAVIAITGIISVTIGSLVMAGWRLNVLESMTMSVGVGLSIDFTLHYGVAYFNCEESQTRKERVHYSLWHVGSAVAMGTVTTFLAGLAMMPSVINAYIQLGHFLMLIMSASWVYSTFFFLALCAVLGPQGQVGHIIRCWKWPFREATISPFEQQSNDVKLNIASKSSTSNE